MKKASSLLVLCLVLLSGCSAPPETGSVQLAVSGAQALSTSISRVTVTASAADFPSTSVDLSSSGGSWGGLIGNLPVGNNRSFLAQAFDSSGSLRFQGQASDILRHAEDIMKIKRRLNEIYVRHTGKDYDTIENTLDRDHFMSAEDAKAFGIVDHVQNKRPEDLAPEKPVALAR